MEQSILRQPLTEYSATARHQAGEEIEYYNARGERCVLEYCQAGEAIAAQGAGLWPIQDGDGKRKLIDTPPAGGDEYGWQGFSLAANVPDDYYFYMQKSGPSLVGLVTATNVAAGDMIWPSAAGVWSTTTLATQAQVDTAKGRLKTLVAATAPAPVPAGSAVFT